MPLHRPKTLTMARRICFISLLLLLAAQLYLAEVSGNDQISLLVGTNRIRVEDSEQPFVCQDPPYTVHLFSTKPLVIYISGFITTEERTHLSNLE